MVLYQNLKFFNVHFPRLLVFTLPNQKPKWRDCLLPPLLTIPAGMWQCPRCTPSVLSFQVTLRHLRLLSPIRASDSDSTPSQNKTKNHKNPTITFPHCPSTVTTPFPRNFKKQKNPLLSPRPANSTCPPAPLTRSVFWGDVHGHVYVHVVPKLHSGSYS